MDAASSLTLGRVVRSALAALVHFIDVSLESVHQRVHHPSRLAKCLRAGSRRHIGLVCCTRGKSALPPDVGSISLAQDKDLTGLEAEFAADAACLAPLLEHRRRLTLLGKVVGCFDDRQFFLL